MRKTNLVFFVFFFFLLFLNSVRADTTAVPFYIEDFEMEWVKINWTVGDSNDHTIVINGKKDIIFEVHTNKTQTIPSANTWYNVSFDGESARINTGQFTHNYNISDNQTICSNETGNFFMTYDLDIIDTAAGTNIGARLMKNGIEIHGSGKEKDIPAISKEISVTHSMPIDLTNGDCLNLEIISDSNSASISTHNTFDMFTSTASFSLVRIGS